MTSHTSNLREIPQPRGRGTKFPTVNLDSFAAQKSNGIASWLLLLGIVLPGDLTFFVGQAKFNPERIAIAVLLLGVPFALVGNRRRFVISDAFVGLTSAWIIGVTFFASRPSSFSSSAAVVLELLGGYMVSRAYFFGRPALERFVQMLKIAVVIVIAVAVLDHLSGKLVVNDFLRLDSEPEYRYGAMRAASVFPHPISYGAFCVAAVSIFLFSERSGIARAFYVGLCLFGCLLAMSSAPLLVFFIAISMCLYDHLVKAYAWRWKVLVGIIASLLLLVFLLTNNPTSWLIEHLTLDPSTGYFRKATWDRAFYNIGLSPLTGYGFDDIGRGEEFFDNASVDSVWLVLALRFGIPVVVLFALANVASFVAFGRKNGGRTHIPYMDHMRTGFTLALVVFMLIGLTVHFWNTAWMLWGVCLGVRASLNEQYRGSIDFSRNRHALSRLRASALAQAG